MQKTHLQYNIIRNIIKTSPLSFRDWWSSLITDFTGPTHRHPAQMEMENKKGTSAGRLLITYSSRQVRVNYASHTGYWSTKCAGCVNVVTTEPCVAERLTWWGCFVFPHSPAERGGCVVPSTTSSSFIDLIRVVVCVWLGSSCCCGSVDKFCVAPPAGIMGTNRGCKLTYRSQFWWKYIYKHTNRQTVTASQQHNILWPLIMAMRI